MTSKLEYIYCFVSARERLYGLLLAVVLVFSGVTLFTNLGAEPFQDYDEATYAEVTTESIARGDYLSLTFLNNEYFRKPPLLFWLTSAAEHGISDSEAAMRLPSVLAALTLIPLVVLVAVEAGAGLGVGVLAATILATTSAFMEPARQVRFDVLITFFIVAALYAGMRAVRAPRWYLAMGVFVACAVLTKSAIAIFAPVALLLYLLQTRGRSFLRDRWFWMGVGMFVLVAAPWHIYQTLRFGSVFWHVYLGTQVLERLDSNLFNGISTNLTTNADYFRFFVRFAAPWSVLFFAGLLSTPFMLRSVPQHVRTLWSTAVGTTAVIAGVMAWSDTKAVTYLIPLYPFVAIALALSISFAWKKAGGSGKALMVGVLMFCSLVAAYLCVWNVHHINPYYSTQYKLAREEYALSQEITKRSSDPTIYTYKNDNLGAIQYYTRLPFSTSRFVYVLESAPEGSEPGFVVTTVSLTELQKQFPQFRFEPLYTGSLLSAFTVTF